MRCPQCQAENRSGARFCDACGTPVALGPASAPRPGIAPEGERRHLTVLFIDLVGATALAARLDTEDWRTVLNRYQETATAVIESYGGYVAQYLGDGMLVYFGYPHAHEDDPERAVRCGLAIVEALPALNEDLEPAYGVDLAVRLGIDTGWVVMSEVGGGPRRETLALGDSANIASRLQDLAEPDTVVLSGATMRLVQGIFVTRDLGARFLKGIAGAVTVHQALRGTGMRSRLEATSWLTPLVGRAEELAVLEDRWRKVRDGVGQALLISGEAGLGKSRLVQAFRGRLSESPHTWLETRGSAYTQGSALYPVLELHWKAFGFVAEASDADKLRGIEAGVAAADFDRSSVPVFASLHGVDASGLYDAPALSPEGLRKRTLDLLARWLVRLGAEQPVVLLIEDLHWMDPSTIDLIDTLLQRISEARVLLLLTFRPDFEPPWPSSAEVTSLALAPLGTDQVGDLVREASRERSLPAEWIDEIARRSDGVPLFVEELTRAVLESRSAHPESHEAGAVVIPETLEDLLMARLDQLGPIKEVAQIGSVIGREFSFELLRALSLFDEERLVAALEEATRRDVLMRRGGPPDTKYVFKHALIRDAAYRSLLRRTRRESHERVALALVELSPRIEIEQPELVAHHWTEAGVTDRAVACWGRAGEVAVASAAHLEAVRHFQRALSLLERAPGHGAREETELSIQLGLGRALVSVRGWGHAENRAVWERARALTDPVRNPLKSGVIFAGLGDAYATSGDLLAAMAWFDRTRALGEESGEELLVLVGHAGSIMVHHYLGSFSSALEHVEDALALYDPDRHDFLHSGFYEDKGINLLCWSSYICWHVGQVDRAWSLATRAIGLARARKDPFGLAFALTWASVMRLLRREWRSARELGAEAAAVGAEQSFPMLEAVARMAELAGTGIETRDPGVPALYLAALGRAAATGNQLGVSVILAYLAEVYLEQGSLAETIGTVDMALGAADATGQHCYDAVLLQIKGEALRSVPEHDDGMIEAIFRDAVQQARAQGARSFELRAATSLARLMTDLGRGAEAREELQAVYDTFTQGFDVPDLVSARALLHGALGLLSGPVASG